MNKEGIGLGLYNVKQLVGMLGPKKEIEIKSKLNEGSIFSFNLYSNIKEKNRITINKN